MSDFLKPPDNAESIQRIARGFQFSRVLLTAVELDVFTAIAQGATTSELVAAECETDPRATDRLMNVLAAMGLLEKRGGKFQNSPAAARCLIKSSPDYLSGLHHTNHLWDSWSTLSAAVVKGNRVEEAAQAREDDKWEEDFIEAMHARAKSTADRTVSSLNLDGVRRTLDIGGGSGVFSMAFLRASKEIRATVFDLPSVIERTRQYVERDGFLDRVDFIPGDLHTSDLGAGYDLVFISAILHMLSPEDCQKLVTRAAAALNPGGQLVVSDVMMDDDRVKPPFGAMFALNMLVATESGDSYTEKEIRKWMSIAGLTSIERIDTKEFSSLMTGRMK